ncbi:MAG: hypothetical protein R3E58_14550 [Phycisphaerae bacterium]
MSLIVLPAIRINWRVECPHEKRAAESNVHNLRPDDMATKGFDVDRDVRQLRHAGASYARRRQPIN